jgi:hypothetical protein
LYKDKPRGRISDLSKYTVQVIGTPNISLEFKLVPSQKKAKEYHFLAKSHEEVNKVFKFHFKFTKMMDWVKKLNDCILNITLEITENEVRITIV